LLKETGFWRRRLFPVLESRCYESPSLKTPRSTTCCWVGWCPRSGHFYQRAQILVVTGVLAVLASITLQAALKNSSHSITPTSFSAEALPLHKGQDRRVTERLACYVLQKTAPFCNGGRWFLLYILLEERRSILVDLGGRSPWLGFMRLCFLGDSGVALDRREADAEEASGLGFGHPAFCNFNYLLRRSSEEALTPL
jgi:hypothetical protein